MNISQIARTYGVDRKTVRRYINKTDWNQPVAKTTVNDFPKLTPYKETIDCWLQDDKKPGEHSGIPPNGFTSGLLKNTENYLTVHTAL